MEVPPRVGRRSGLFLLAHLAPGPLLAVSRAITAGPQKTNRRLLAWDGTPGSSYWGLMHQTCLDQSPEPKPTGSELPKSIVLN